MHVPFIYPLYHPYLPSHSPLSIIFSTLIYPCLDSSIPTFTPYLHTSTLISSMIILSTHIYPLIYTHLPLIYPHLPPNLPTATPLSTHIYPIINPHIPTPLSTHLFHSYILRCTFLTTHIYLYLFFLPLSSTQIYYLIYLESAPCLPLHPPLSTQISPHIYTESTTVSTHTFPLIYPESGPLSTQNMPLYLHTPSPLSTHTISLIYVHLPPYLHTPSPLSTYTFPLIYPHLPPSTQTSNEGRISAALLLEKGHEPGDVDEDVVVGLHEESKAEAVPICPLEAHHGLEA